MNVCGQSTAAGHYESNAHSKRSPITRAGFKAVSEAPFGGGPFGGGTKSALP